MASRAPIAFLIAFIAVLWAGSARAATLIVQPGPGAIGAAIRSAHPGDLIRVEPGIYHEHVVINKKVAVQAYGRTVIDGGGVGRVVSLEAPGATFTGFTVNDSGMDKDQSDAGIFIAGPATGALAAKNVIENSAFGIWVDGTHGAVLRGNLIIGNLHYLQYERGYGIELWDTRGALVEDNRIRRSLDGIYVISSNRDRLIDNRISEVRYGIHYMLSDYDALAGNVVTHCRAGLALMTVRWLTVSGNSISYVGEEGAILGRDAYYCTFDDNRLVSNALGLFLYDTVYATIRHNLLMDNVLAAHVWAGSYLNTVYDNSFIDNRQQVEYEAAQDVEWSYHGRGNYWSNYIGWVGKTPGIGAIPYRLNTLLDRLVWENPLVQLLLNANPVSQLLLRVETQFPVLLPPSVVDSHPLLKPTFTDLEEYRS